MRPSDWVIFASVMMVMAGIFGMINGLTLDDRTDHRFGIDKLPVALLGGATFAAVREFQRRRKEASAVIGPEETVRLSGARVPRDYGCLAPR